MVVFTVSRSPVVRSAVSYSAMLSLWNSMLSVTPGELWLSLAKRASSSESKLSSESLCWLANALALDAPRLQRPMMSLYRVFATNPAKREPTKYVYSPFQIDQQASASAASPALRKQTSNSTVVWAASRRHCQPASAQLGRARSRTARHMTAGSA